MSRRFFGGLLLAIGIFGFLGMGNLPRSQPNIRYFIKLYQEHEKAKQAGDLKRFNRTVSRAVIAKQKEDGRPSAELSEYLKDSFAYYDHPQLRKLPLRKFVFDPKKDVRLIYVGKIKVDEKGRKVRKMVERTVFFVQEAGEWKIDGVETDIWNI